MEPGLCKDVGAADSVLPQLGQPGSAFTHFIAARSRLSGGTRLAAGVGGASSNPRAPFPSDGECIPVTGNRPKLQRK